MKQMVINNNQFLAKRPIAPVLRSMEIGNTEVFTILQMDTVRAAVVRVQQFDRSLKFKTETETTVIKVTRLS
jgi:hypothetical protein